ncbi:7395_t:CDS:2 [Funneliformis geosporum]|nr:7395_t:CDS:2 [Funneliformis geosporum]
MSIGCISTLTTDESTLEKRTSCLSKRGVLGKRTDSKCPCALAEAVFEGAVGGLTVYAQDECGFTTVTGLFSKGFQDTNKNFTFQVVDDCGTVLQDLTEGLKVQPSGDGGTKSFRNLFENFSLNCGNTGILVPQNGLTKRTCSRKLKKRQGSGAYMRINEGGDSYAQADINEI